jgi:hypothetical protein
MTAPDCLRRSRFRLGLVRRSRFRLGWVARRKELLAIGLFCVLSIVIPLRWVEFYPFSRAPMFADAPRRYCDYMVHDPLGEPLSLEAFHLQRNYWGNPSGVGVGFLPPPTVGHFGQVPSQRTITRVVQQRLRDFPQLPYVRVTQRIIGPMDAQRVGVMAEETWQVDNPHHQEKTEE